MADAKVPLSFRIFKGDQLIRQERLSLSVIKLGKVPSAHLKLDDETVSRMHAIIESNGANDVTIIDLGSTKGTFVNGHKVNKARLQSGDVISVGDTRIELTIGGEDTVTAAPITIPAPTAIATSMASYAAPTARSVIIAPPAPVASLAFSPSRQLPSPSPAVGELDDASGPQAIEVAAMLGDSVVKVQHCSSGNAGKISSRTWMGLAASGICLAASAFAFISALRGASFNAAKFQHWTDLKKPTWSFRPEMLNLNFDWLMLAGMVLGLVGVVYSLVRMRRETESTPQFRIGNAPEVEFPIDSAPSASFPLIKPRGDAFVFNFASSMEGEITVDGQSMTLADAVAQGRAHPSLAIAGALELPIPRKARIRVRSGQTTFLLSSVAAPRRQPSPLFVSLETMAMVFVAGSALAHIGFLFLLNLAGNDGTAGGTDSADNEDVSMRSVSTANNDPTPEQQEQKPTDSDKDPGGTGTAAIGPSGKMGLKESSNVAGQFQIKKTSEQQQLARAEAVEQARNAGILGSSALQRSDAFASLTGTGDMASGLDDSNINGGLLGDKPGTMNGGFGNGLSGFGNGANGTGLNTIGVGSYGYIGHGKGVGDNYTMGNGNGQPRGHKPPTIMLIGQPLPVGDLDKSIIRRYIMRSQSRFSYCYEKQLLADKSLAGTVMAQFFISANGTVSVSSAKGVHIEVSSCVADVIKAIEFPKPKNGAGVQVNYPFTFRQAGGV
jgi:hypothetical protein